jgi:hypothetical protein
MIRIMHNSKNIEPIAASPSYISIPFHFCPDSVRTSGGNNSRDGKSRILRSKGKSEHGSTGFSRTRRTRETSLSTSVYEKNVELFGRNVK